MGMKPYQRSLLLLYSATVFVGSIIHSLFTPPQSVFSNKHNPLNQLFAKRGWVRKSCRLLSQQTLTRKLST